MRPATQNDGRFPGRRGMLARRLFYLTLGLCITAWAAPRDRVILPIDRSETIVLRGGVHPSVLPHRDEGPVDPSMKLTYVSLLIQPSAEQQDALTQLLAEQQDPKSRNYHNWLTPEQFGERFGLSHGDIGKITRWLHSEGFSVPEIAHGRNWIAISGTVAQFQRTFQTQIHRFQIDGEERYANIAEPSVPKALAGIVVGLSGLNNFRIKPLIVERNAAPDYTTGGGGHVLAPDDIATIFDIAPLYKAGIDGTGMKIAIMGQSDVHITDIQQFRAGFNLAKNDPTMTIGAGLGCVDPGIQPDEVEADLDLEWSGAIARNASIIFVRCDPNHGGVISSLRDAVNSNTAPVLSMSYGVCEASLNQQGFPFPQYEAVLQQANAQGQTLMVSSGDSGAATCDAARSSQAIGGFAVNGFASPPEITSVGGTEFNEGSGTYWNPSNGSNGGSAISYIPELAWDDSIAGTGFSSGLWSTGGGASIVFRKPSFQTGPGKFDSAFRSLPDVSMPASADHDGYIFCTTSAGVGTCAKGIAQAVASNSVVGGTSASSPVFAGIVALLNQSLKNTPPSGLGNINPALYQLAQSLPTAFHDVPAGNYNIGGSTNPSGNVVPCRSGTRNCPANGQYGFQTVTGYDEVTGLGSVDAYNLVSGWGTIATASTTTTLTITPAAVNFGATSAVALSATVKPTFGSGTPTGTITFFNGSTQIGQPVTLNNRTASTNYPTNLLAANTYSITATYSGDTTFPGSKSTPSSLNVEDFIVVASPATVTVSSPGQSGTTTLTITPLGGFNQTISYACTGLPAESTCTFTAASSTKETLTIATRAPLAKRDPSPVGRGRTIFYALLLPGFLGLAVSSGCRKRNQRGVRLLGLLAVLAVSTLSMPACGGGSSGGTPSDPGTPKGSSSVTVTATAGSLSHSTPISLSVQ